MPNQSRLQFGLILGLGVGVVNGGSCVNCSRDMSCGARSTRHAIFAAVSLFAGKAQPCKYRPYMVKLTLWFEEPLQRLPANQICNGRVGHQRIEEARAAVESAVRVLLNNAVRLVPIHPGVNQRQ
jgi:hypothetical protein